MKKNEELLHRCLDGDLNDVEMQHLFLAMSNDAELRSLYRELQSLQSGLQSIPKPVVPESLDKRMQSFSPPVQRTLVADRPSMRRFIGKRISLPLPAMIAMVLFAVIGSYVAAKSSLIAVPEKEFIYVVEMQPVVIQSNYSN